MIVWRQFYFYREKAKPVNGRRTKLTLGIIDKSYPCVAMKSKTYRNQILYERVDIDRYYIFFSFYIFEFILRFNGGMLSVINDVFVDNEAPVVTT